MKVFAVSDLHLSGGVSDKPMDIFGPVWDGYLETIERDWAAKVTDEDIVLLPGDLSWAMKIDEAKADIDYIGAFQAEKSSYAAITTIGGNLYRQCVRCSLTACTPFRTTRSGSTAALSAAPVFGRLPSRAKSSPRRTR